VNLELFVSTFVLITLAEMPDKTAIAILLMATRKNPYAIFIGVAFAFLVQTLVAVLFGHFLSLLPPYVVKVGGALMFLVFAYLMWKDRNSIEEPGGAAHGGGGRAGFLKTVWSSFIVIFIAEWGDLTQFATAALVAEYKDPLTIGVAATLALWFASTIAIVIGNRAKHFINPSRIKKIAAFAFVVIAIWQLISIF
jgi:Ca2+/H+ antiporter, TMEM165/GDT1 family